jgi:hypothetical protein
MIPYEMHDVYTYHVPKNNNSKPLISIIYHHQNEPTTYLPILVHWACKIYLKFTF